MLRVFSALATLAFAADASKSRNWEKTYRNGDYLSPPLADNSTYGNTDQIHTSHLHLNIAIDFDQRTLSGNALHTMKVIADTDVVQFDIWDLTITGAYNVTDGSAFDFSIVQPNPAIGSVLVINFPRNVSIGESVDVGISYTTSPTGQAFSWLTAEQTAGQKLPYMFTQCEDINCRSVAPLQDTPSNRITYSANFTASQTFQRFQLPLVA